MLWSRDREEDSEHKEPIHPHVMTTALLVLSTTEPPVPEAKPFPLHADRLANSAQLSFLFLDLGVRTSLRQGALIYIWGRVT